VTLRAFLGDVKGEPPHKSKQWMVLADCWSCALTADPGLAADATRFYLLQASSSSLSRLSLELSLALSHAFLSVSLSPLSLPHTHHTHTNTYAHTLTNQHSSHRQCRRNDATELAHADMTTLPKVYTICTALSLIPTVNGNTVRSFSAHGHQSAAKGSSTTVSRSGIRLILTF
jgi:hypothetical protein